MCCSRVRAGADNDIGGAGAAAIAALKANTLPVNRVEAALAGMVAGNTELRVRACDLGGASVDRLCDVLSRCSSVRSLVMICTACCFPFLELNFAG